MKLFSAFLLILLLGGVVLAQEPAAKPAARATVDGIVTRDPDGEPLKKALIEVIAENQSEGGDYTAVTGPDGAFHIEGILPGRYHLFAERTGLLDADKNRGRSEGRILTLTAGQELKDVHIRLQAAAVVRGRVTDEDGDPLPNAEVTVMRQTFVSGRKHWEQAGAERTNDLGEYRIANLPAGYVYISVNPPPDFQSLIDAVGSAGGDSHNPSPEKSGATTYPITYYPGTSDRSQIASIQLHPGDDFPANFSLIPVPSVNIRGSVVNLPPRTSATIMLQSRDLSLVLNGAEMHKDGSFLIRDVVPGSYTILATVEGSPVPMSARQPLQVGSANVDGVRLSPQPGATLHGRLRLEGKGVARFDPEQIFLTLESIDGEHEGTFMLTDGFSNVTHVAADGSFVWTDVPPGTYYAQMANRDTGTNEDWYVKSVLAGGRDANDSGISISGGTMLLDVVASSNGGIVDGVVADQKGEPVANAVVVAVPDQLRGRMDRYRKTVSDQSGRFSLRGLRPGSYQLFAWESVDGEAYYNPDFLRAYEGQGIGLRLGDGEHKSLPLNVISATEDQP